MRKDQQTRKLMIRTAAYRARLVARRRPASNEPAVRLTLAVLMWLAATPPVSEGRATQTPPAAAPLDLQITQVRPLAALASTATADIGIRWTARVARLTTLEGFDVSVEVRYSDGSRGTAVAPALKATARSATLQIAAHPKANGGATLKSFHASLRARFKVTAARTVVQQFPASSGGSARAEAGGQPQIAITDARLAPACAANRQCIDVRWSASAPRNITIDGFIVSVEAPGRDGASHAESKNAAAADRQIRLAVDTGGSAIASFQVTLNADFSLLDSLTVTRDGAF